MRWRLKFGATQHHLAKYLGIKPAFVAMVELDKRKLTAEAKEREKLLEDWVKKAEQIGPEKRTIGDVELYKLIQYLQKTERDTLASTYRKSEALQSMQNKFDQTLTTLQLISNMSRVTDSISSMPDHYWLDNIREAQKSVTDKNSLVEQAKLTIRMAGLKAELEATRQLLQRVGEEEDFIVEMIRG